MADLHKNPEPIADKLAHSGSGGAVTITVCFLALLGGLLLASSYWRESAQPAGLSPQFNVRVVGGPLPGVVVEPIHAAAGTMRLPVDPPTADVGQGPGAPAKAATR